jgi:amino acid transporter
VLGEIRRPRKTMPIGTSIGVTIIIVLYLLVNVAYVSTMTAFQDVFVSTLTSV